MKTSSTTQVLGLAFCLGALPVLTMVTGCVGDRYHQSTGESIDDHGTSSRVKSALANDTEYKYPDINVVTFKGVVQLSGFVNTHAQRSRADDLAKEVENVKDVENNITVKE